MELASFYFIVLPLALLIFILVSLAIYLENRGDKQTKRLKKLMNKYVKDRVEQEKLFDKQLKALASMLEIQLQNKLIDQNTYMQMKGLLEINLAKLRDEARSKIMP